MKHEIAEKWVKALRSGEYKQGRYVLCLDNEYCCLGVLCELALKEKVCSKTLAYSDFSGSPYRYEAQNMSSASCVILKVREWSGLSSSNGWFENDGINTDLSRLNDRGVSFRQIADVIEENWDKL